MGVMTVKHQLSFGVLLLLMMTMMMMLSDGCNISDLLVSLVVYDNWGIYCASHANFVPFTMRCFSLDFDLNSRNEC